MPRRPRIHFEGAIYHAMSRGVEGRPIFLDNLDRNNFLIMLRRCEKGMGAQILSYCLMGNHFHLAIKVGRCPLSAFMQRLEGGYAGLFNYRHERIGHLFQSRYKSNLCLTDRYLLALKHYIHLNPVRAGLVAKPSDWPWSSYTPSDEAPILEGFEPWASSQQALIRPAIKDSVELDVIGAAVARANHVSVDSMKSHIKLKNLVRTRRAFVSQGLLSGHTLASMARWLNTTRSTVSRYAAE